MKYPPMEIRAMRHGERELVLDLLENVFCLRGRFALYMDTDPLYDPQDFLLALDAGRPVSCVQVVEKRICLAGQEIPLGGISSVATHPDYRGRGLAGRLLAGSEERMRRRGMPLGLLFTARSGFYARHGWIKVPMDLIILRRGGAVAAADSNLVVRAFRDTDFETVRVMYARQNAFRPGSTVRSESYWRGQLRYAGTPEEQFRIAERGGKTVAYARLIETTGLQVMEHACLPDETRALASLILAHCPEKRRMFIRSPPAALDKALAESGVTLKRMRDPAPMWRVLDPVWLSALAGQAGDDEALITELIRKPRTHYWLSDRF